ncbi:TPA: hypothetical protein DIC62_00630, partial [Candidatus Nomurabacteria bacterium]|nr:hypothetical protein [Candidatus Nomurabacteria bacterium]
VGVPQFEDRDYIITDEQIDAAYRLDELLVSYEYDEILDMMNVKASHVAEEEVCEDEPPVVNRRKPAPKEVKEEVEEKEVEPKHEPKQSETSTCPHGANFGVDYDEYTECDNCVVNDDCLAKKEANAIAEQKKNEKKPVPRRKLKQNVDDDDIPF